MRPKLVSAVYGRRFNLGNYESLHVEVTAWADLDEGESLEEVGEALRAYARGQVQREWARQPQSKQGQPRPKRDS